MPIIPNDVQGSGENLEDDKITGENSGQHSVGGSQGIKSRGLPLTIEEIKALGQTKDGKLHISMDSINNLLKQRGYKTVLS